MLTRTENATVPDDEGLRRNLMDLASRVAFAQIPLAAGLARSKRGPVEE
jgi:hypothetical protein